MPFGEWVSGLVIFQLGFPYEPSEVLLKMIKFLESHPIPSSPHLKQIPEVQVRRKRLTLLFCVFQILASPLP